MKAPSMVYGGSLASQTVGQAAVPNSEVPAPVRSEVPSFFHSKLLNFYAGLHIRE